MLDELFRLQSEQQENWKQTLVGTDEDEYLQYLTLCCIHELMEFLDARGYKRHKIWYEPSPRSQQVMELIDAQKYLLVMAQTLGVTPEEWFEVFKEKTEIVQQRWEQDQAQWVDQKIVVCDIDDVLADYEGRAKETSREEIEERHGFRELEPVDDNIQALRDLAQSGYHIVLMTSRRAWRVGAIQADTIAWLREHEVPYEAILWSYDKAEAIHTRLRHTLPEFAVENSRKHAIDIADLGIKVYFLFRDDMLNYPNVVNVRSLSEISEVQDGRGRDGI